MKRIAAFLSMLSIAVASFAQPHIVKEGLSGVPGGGIEFKGLLYFPLYEDARYFDADLWKSDGTPQGTVLVKDFSTVHGMDKFVVWNGNFFFLRRDEVWKSDGTGAGTVLLKSFDSGITVWYLTAGDDEVYFQTINETGEKNELWKSDGTVSGTVKVVDILPLIHNEVPSFTYANGFLFFWSTTADHGSELWRSDGSAGGTVMVKDINPGLQSSYYDRYDFYYPMLTSVGNKVFFVANNGATGLDLWMSDGTEIGTVLVKDLSPGIDSPSQLTAAGNTLFFSATDDSNGEELWKSDGTPQGTVMLKDITPGAIGSYPALLTAVNDELYFVAGDGYKLWKSDGTANGTLMVADVFPYGYGFTGINGMVFLSARTQSTGDELWVTDGTAAGAHLVKDIRPGEFSSFPRRMTAVGNNLFFTANDGHGETLWVNETSPQEVSNFTLINALTDTDIGTINDGDVINLAALPTKKLNIRFETDMVSGSVTFQRNGRHVRTENSAPYAMAGDEPTNNYSIWTPAVGEYEVCATSHSGYGGRGIQGETECVHFTVVNVSVGITHFTLVNADTDEDIQNLHQGDVIDLAMLPTTNLNIRANTNPPVVGSVCFFYNEISDDMTSFDNAAPYALFGDSNGDYLTGDFSPCECFLGANAFSEADFGGDYLGWQDVTFSLINSAASKMSESEEMETALNAGELQLYPNPNQGIFKISYSAETTNDLSVEVFDLFGKSVFREQLLSFSGAYQHTIDLSAYPQGVYLLRVNDGAATSVRKVVISE